MQQFRRFSFRNFKIKFSNLDSGILRLLVHSLSVGRVLDSSDKILYRFRCNCVIINRCTPMYYQKCCALFGAHKTKYLHLIELLEELFVFLSLR